jgi:hypothetical protein
MTLPATWTRNLNWPACSKKIEQAQNLKADLIDTAAWHFLPQ